MTDAEREALWEAFLAIGARNSDKDPEEVERDVVEEIEAMRRERHQERRAHLEGTPTA